MKIVVSGTNLLHVLRSVQLIILLGLLVAASCQPIAETPVVPVTPSAIQKRKIDSKAQGFLAEAMHAMQRKAYMTGLAFTDSVDHYTPNLPETHFIRGRIFFELGRVKEARAAYRMVLDLQPDYKGAWHNLGNAAFEQRQFLEALTYYHKEKDLHPEANPWHGIGGAYWMLGKADSARIAYENAIKTDVSYAPAHHSLAEWYESDGSFEEALHHAQKALQLSPDQIDYQYSVGALLYRTGQYEAAIQILQPVIAKRSWNYSAMFTLGQALQQLGRTEEALPYLEQANHVRAQQQEVERLERSTHSIPDNFQLQIDYANVLRRTGRLSEAIKVYHIALSLRPGNLSLQNNLATLYLQQNDTTEALNRYHYILQQDSTFAETWLNLGMHYARTGRMVSANRAWQKAVSYDANNPAVKSFMERMQQK